MSIIGKRYGDFRINNPISLYIRGIYLNISHELSSSDTDGINRSVCSNTPMYVDVISGDLYRISR